MHLVVVFYFVFFVPLNSYNIGFVVIGFSLIEEKIYLFLKEKRKKHTSIDFKGLIIRKIIKNLVNSLYFEVSIVSERKIKK